MASSKGAKLLFGVKPVGTMSQKTQTYKHPNTQTPKHPRTQSSTCDDLFNNLLSYERGPLIKKRHREVMFRFYSILLRNYALQATFFSIGRLPLELS